MNWEAFVGSGVALGLAVLGQWISAVKLGTRLDVEGREKDRRLNDSEADRKELRKRIDEIGAEAVKRGDFERFDDKVAARFDKIEHAVNNGALKSAQVVKDALRDMLPLIRGQQ